MGQCGQGHNTSPITRPKKITGLEGVTVQQISAGTSHSIAWTALPTDRSEIYNILSKCIHEVTTLLCYLSCNVPILCVPLTDKSLPGIVHFVLIFRRLHSHFYVCFLSVTVMDLIVSCPPLHSHPKCKYH